MKLSNELATLLNRQIGIELSSSNNYLQMGASLAELGLTGMAAWMRLQSDEERAHALRILDFVSDRGNQVVIGAIDAAPDVAQDQLALFESALSQERYVTEQLTAIYTAAQHESDVSAMSLL